MKKMLALLLSAALLLGSGSFLGTAGTAAAAEQTRIRDIGYGGGLLMDDGSMWTTGNLNQPIHTPGTVQAISPEGLGVTANGELIQWDNVQSPRPVKGQTGVKQVAGDWWLKADGTVWSLRGQVEQLSDIRLIAHGDRTYAALTNSGKVLLQGRPGSDSFFDMGTVSDVSSVVQLAAYDSRAALLYSSGKVVTYETFTFDDNAKFIPTTITEDAVHIVYAEETREHPTDGLIVTRKDGTVWTTGSYQNRSKLTDQLPGLSGIARTAVPDSLDSFYAMRSDGSWVKYAKGKTTDVTVPGIQSLSVAVSDAKPFVGDSIRLDIQETFTNGAKVKVPAGEAAITVQNPHVLKLLSNGRFKVLAVGQTEITVTSGGHTKSVKVTASLRNGLTGAKQVKGVVFVPFKTVVQTLGGTVTSANGGLNAKLGDSTLFVKVGSKTAKLNDKTITLKAAPITDRGATLVPATLLTAAYGATVKWDNDWKQVHLSFGGAEMTVSTAETAVLVKKAAQGNLARLIGKSYWVNYFQDWERFMKVTITDIEPDNAGYFVVVFKTGSGKTLRSYSMSASNVYDLFAGGTAFFNYDPYKKYKWPASVWNQIKAGKISLGMTKEQVQFSWGLPSGRSTSSANGTTIETWVYSNFDTVAFINGKVEMIIT